MISKEIVTPLPSREIYHPEIERIRIFPTPEIAAKAAARSIALVVALNRLARITYATGNTMIPVYEHLKEVAKSDFADFSQTTAFHLDEYLPASPDDTWGFVNFLRKRVFEPLKIGTVNEFDGLAKEPALEAARYDRLLSEAPIDLAILGIGPWSDETKTGCHIAFNESGTPFAKRTHIQKLNEVTVARDQIERGQDSPDRAFTQGIANILEAKQIILVAYGKEKGQALHEALYGEIGEERPASALRKVGNKVEVYIDEEAASVF